MEKPLHEVEAEHLSNCMCLELIEHANLAIGDADAERFYLETMIREKVCIGQQRISTRLTMEGGLLCSSGRSDLVGALVFIWDHSMEEHSTNLIKIRKYIENMIYVLMSVSQTSLEPNYDKYGFITIRAKALYALQCYRMTEAMVVAKKKLPIGSPPTEDFFAAMLPVVCRTDFKDLLTEHVRELCPDIW